MIKLFSMMILLLPLLMFLNPAVTAQKYGYGGASDDALEAYHQGWHEILVNGRWSEAERLFRHAVNLDPEFIIGKALVGRISHDVPERKAILSDINANLNKVDADGRLILDVFLMNIEAAIARAEGHQMPAGFAEKRATIAVQNFEVFSKKYPDDTGILIEYLEWLHATSGAEATLAKINEIKKDKGSSTPFITFFTSLLYAELGQNDRALLAANIFEKVIDNPDIPQPYYLYAIVYRSLGRLREAKRMIDKAVTLDANHLIAKGLQAQIDEALAAKQ